MSTKGMRPVHPGEILREDYLADLGMSASALARALAVPVPRINDVLRERRGTTAQLPSHWSGQPLITTFEIAGHA